MKHELRGWGEIARYLGVGRRTAMRYESRGELRVHRLGKGPRARVYAYKEEIDQLRMQAATTSTGDSLKDRILDRIAGLSSGVLYRRGFVVRFDLRPRGIGIQAKIEVEYEVVNSSSERRPYTQEVTIDDCEHGHVESMFVASDGKPIYVITRPAVTEKLKGYAAYRGRTLLLEPSAWGHRYTGKAVWIINRPESDFWYLHMGIPTLGVEAKISAPTDFDITSSFSSGYLYLKGEHIDITWERNRGR